MKILVVSPLLPSPAVRMRGLHSSPQHALMQRLGHDVKVVVPVSWRPPSPRASWRARRAVPLLEHDDGVEVHHPRFLSLGPLARGAASARMQRELFWRALRGHVEGFARAGGAIVHAHSAGLPGVMQGRTGGARLVVSMWDHELYDLAPASPAWRALIAHTLRTADAVVYISKALRSVGEELVGRHEAHVIPLAIEEYPDIAPAPPERFTVVTAARLIPRKEIATLVEAFARFSAGAPEARLVVVGDGPERGRLEALARTLGIAGAVEMTGALSHREVRERMARAHLFVLPSVRESLGTVYFEAMSVGVPVVGLQGEGIAEHVTDGVDGFLVRRGDVEALASILRSMHGEPQRRAAIGARARALFDRSGVRWPDWVAAHLALFESLL